jgi:predicted GNAT family acetyltransferase
MDIVEFKNEQLLPAAELFISSSTIAITAAFTKPKFRGRGAATAVLDIALQDYASRGSLDFESFNPEAGSFWMKYFQPVCFLLTRIPET